MQEYCMCGSVRGALGNPRPYRDTEHDSNSVTQALRKSWKGKDGIRLFVAHNPKFVSSNLTPATIFLV